MQLDKDISAYTYEKTLAMEQRSKMLNMINKQRSGPAGQQQRRPQLPSIPVPLSPFVFQTSIYTVSQKNVPPLACYNSDAHEWILIFFGRNVTDKVGNQKMLYYATSNNLCFCTTWQNAETRKSHISLSWNVLHTMHLCAIFLKEKKRHL